MTAWVYIDSRVVIAIHEEQLAEHGGGVGVRDPGLLESALARPANRAAYGDPDVAGLAAAYAYGIARNHPFVDGNKRTAFVCAELFLTLNRWELLASDADCVLTMLALAAGELDEAGYAAWLRAHARPREAR
jgi:death-on-curing protein